MSEPTTDPRSSEKSKLDTWQKKKKKKKYTQAYVIQIVDNQKSREKILKKELQVGGILPIRNKRNN